ncbi:MAG: tetratricopeptide repeat protein [Myxococcales bacterium]|nr:tetratricopeptide repeat protein [Myxococcales bacterium]
MKLDSVSKVACLAAVFVAASACSRDHIEAINLANEGDQAIKVNTEGAIQKYEQAIQLDPTNHRIMWKLAKAYEKKEDWDKLASTLSRASQVAPTFANYYYKRGYALVKMAEAGNPDKYEEAKEPLKKCIEKDPNFAECYHFLGETSLWTNDEQGALDNYTKAVEHDAVTPYFYPPLAELYIAMRFYKEADAVLKEGTRVVPPGEKNNNHLYGMYVLRFQVAQASNDKAGMVAAMEKAEEVAGDSHPEIAFNLGSTYAVMDPPQKEKAVRLLSSFVKRACRSAKAAQFKEQCESANTLIQKLGGKVN